MDVTWMTTVTRRLASREVEQMLNEGTNAATYTKDPATQLAHTTIAAPKRNPTILMCLLLSQLQSHFSLLGRW